MGAPVMERAGSSGNAGIGSHLAGADASEGRAGQVASSGSSGNTENGSHLAGADAAEGLAGGGPSGVNENGQVGRWDFGKGKARAALSARKCHQRYMAKCQKRLTPGSGGLQRWAQGGHVAAHPTAPYRIRSSVVRDGLAGQFGTENGPVYARFILAPGPHAAVAAAQVVM